MWRKTSKQRPGMLGVGNRIWRRRSAWGHRRGDWDIWRGFNEVMWNRSGVSQTFFTMPGLICQTCTSLGEPPSATQTATPHAHFKPLTSLLCGGHFYSFCSVVWHNKHWLCLHGCVLKVLLDLPLERFCSTAGPAAHLFFIVFFSRRLLALACLAVAAWFIQIAASCARWLFCISPHQRENSFRRESGAFKPQTEASWTQRSPSLHTLSCLHVFSQNLKSSIKTDCFK